MSELLAWKNQAAPVRLGCEQDAWLHPPRWCFSLRNGGKIEEE